MNSIRKRRQVLSRFLFFVLIGLAVAGCGMSKQERLGADDLRFAAFYGDYLSRMRHSPEGGDMITPELNAVGLDSLFRKNGLDRKSFDARLQAYSQDPELWRKVLERVRDNLRTTP
jgi:hypothetical protein